jgi:sugar phosphate isomerase/epimerase
MSMSKHLHRRAFLGDSLRIGGAALLTGPLCRGVAQAAAKPTAKMAFGLVTYLWADDWDLPTLLANCEKARILGVELRTGHKHGVEPSLSKAQRAEVKKRFQDSPVACVGPGCNECFDHPDPARLKTAIERTKAFVMLSRDIGGSGVKVKPNDFHKDVPREKTLEQIGKSLNVVGRFAGDCGQRIRLEVHGSCGELPTIKQIMDIADDPHVGVCWNSNPEDLRGGGLEHNFNLVKNRFGDTAHVRELDDRQYPYAKLMKLFVEMGCGGWILLEGRGRPKDRVQALAAQREIWERMILEQSP